jgi:hypothetical protein
MIIGHDSISFPNSNIWESQNHISNDKKMEIAENQFGNIS